MNTSQHTPLPITHRPEIGRFEAVVDGLPCELDYVMVGRIMRITHTGVHPALEGRGIAAALTQTALSWARSQQWQVEPLCSYVRAYVQRHPEWRDLTGI